MADKKLPYRVLAPRVDDVHLEEALNQAWNEGYELKWVVPESGPHNRNIFFIMTPRKGK